MNNLLADPVSAILNPRYSSEFLIKATDSLRDELDRTGILVFNDFLSPQAVWSLQKEAAALKSTAYRSTSAYNVYVLPDDPAFPPDSARNRRAATTKGCIPDDRIPRESALRTLYDSATFRQFLCTILDVPALYPYADPLSCININYYDPGDALQWHFDNADFAVTLLLKKCDKGGVYEYFTDMRYAKDGTEDYETVRKCIDAELKPKTQVVQEGGLMIFRGNRSLHRVTTVEAGERILVTLNFNTKPGVSLSEKSRQTFFGRTT